MASIKFVKFYTTYGREYAEIVYESGKYRGAAADALPKTAAAWLEGKGSFEYYSVVYNRSETIYASDTDIEQYKAYAVPEMTVHRFLYGGGYKHYMGSCGDLVHIVDGSGSIVATYAIPSNYGMRWHSGEQPDGTTRVKNIRVRKDEHGKRTAYVEI